MCHNSGGEYTCVCGGGRSVTDLTFTFASVACALTRWQVADTDTLFDHRYIRFRYRVLGSAHPVARAVEGGNRTPRWSRKRLNKDLLMAAALSVTWNSCENPGMPNNAEECEGRAVQFRGVMHTLCDAAMLRVEPLLPRRTAYWWSGEIARLRDKYDLVRRQYERTA